MYWRTKWCIELKQIYGIFSCINKAKNKYYIDISQNLSEDPWWNSTKIWKPGLELSLFFQLFPPTCPFLWKKKWGCCQYLFHGPHGTMGIGTFGFPVQFFWTTGEQKWWYCFLRLDSLNHCLLSSPSLLSLCYNSESWQSSSTWLAVNEDFSDCGNAGFFFLTQTAMSSWGSWLLLESLPSGN